MSCQVKCFTCGETLTISIDFFEGEAAETWRKHGHFPGKVLLICKRETLLTGPEVTSIRGGK